MMNDEKLAAKVVAGFLADIPQQIEKLKQLLDQGDAEDAGHQADTIKGAARNVGGMALGEVAAKIEEAGKSGDLATCASQFPEVSHQFDALREGIHLWQNRNRAATAGS